MNPYNVLGISPNATKKEMKSAYYALAKMYHPDNNPVGEAMFKRIANAYEILSNDDKRSRFDNRGSYEPLTRNEYDFYSEEIRNLFKEYVNIRQQNLDKISKLNQIINRPTPADNFKKNIKKVWNYLFN